MVQLSFFPTPYPDEDFRSIVHRYHIRSLNSEMMQSRFDLFGVKSSKNIPRNISALIERLPQDVGITAEQLIHSHTLFPLFKPFLSEKQLNDVYNDLLYGKQFSGHARQLSAQREFRTISHMIRYCPLCLQKDFKEYGEVFAHRIHQLVFLESCPQHDVKLISRCPICSEYLSKKNAEGLLVTPLCPNGHELRYECLKPEGLQKLIYSNIKYLLMNFDGINFDIAFEILREACWERGYYTYSGQLLSKLREDFIRHFTTESLYVLGQYRECINSRRIWRLMLKPNDKFKNILIYILLMIFFEGSIEKFTKRERVDVKNHLPFGCGPWPCLNSVCSHYKQPIIRKYKRLQMINCIHFVQFRCPICKGEYSNSWNWKTKRRGYLEIKDLGLMWEQQVIELYAQSPSRREFCKAVSSRVEDVRKEIIEFMGYDYREVRFSNKFVYSKINELTMTIIQDGNPPMREVAAARTFDSDLQEYRDRISNIVKSNPNLMRSQIKKLLGRDYEKLMKHDREWMEEILPKSRSRQKKLNLTALDQELCHKVEDIIPVLYQSNPPHRIRKNNILKALDKIDQSRFCVHKEKLPNTRAMLEKNTESREGYLIRHVSCIVTQLKNKGYRNVNFKNIASYRRSYLNLPEDQLSTIEQKIQEANNVQD